MARRGARTKRPGTGPTHRDPHRTETLAVGRGCVGGRYGCRCGDDFTQSRGGGTMVNSLSRSPASAGPAVEAEASTRARLDTVEAWTHTRETRHPCQSCRRSPPSPDGRPVTSTAPHACPHLHARNIVQTNCVRRVTPAAPRMHICAQASPAPRSMHGVACRSARMRVWGCMHGCA